MKLASTPPVHLTYCSNIYPGESWPETLQNIRSGAAAVKARLSPDAPFGLGLRLSARAAQSLVETPGELGRLRAELDERGLYVFTLNGFPYGEFHGVPVKRQVYRPDWRTRERLAYTRALGEILAHLLPEGVSGSISTVPVAYRPEGREPGALALAVSHLLECAAFLWRQRETRGVELALALEPEPACYLETTAEAVQYVQSELFDARARRSFGALTGLSASAAELALRRHLGLCLDACHAAVEFEEPRESVRMIAAAGVRLAKVQATAGLHVEPVGEAQRRALASFADPVYLHQVVARGRAADGSQALVRFEDLDEAFASLARGEHDPECWRVHYHVPIFERALAPFCNTQDFLARLLDEVLARALCDQFEVETYTWSVLPEPHRKLELSAMIAAELGWMMRALAPEVARAP